MSDATKWSSLTLKKKNSKSGELTNISLHLEEGFKGAFVVSVLLLLNLAKKNVTKTWDSSNSHERIWAIKVTQDEKKCTSLLNDAGEDMNWLMSDKSQEKIWISSLSCCVRNTKWVIILNPFHVISKMILQQKCDHTECDKLMAAWFPGCSILKKTQSLMLEEDLCPDVSV